MMTQESNLVTYNPKFEEFFTDRKFYKILYGSAGSGKSYSCAQKIAIRFLTESGHHIWAFRKVSTYVRESVYATMKEVLINYFESAGENYNHYVRFNKTLHTITCLHNGNQISCCGLDEPEKIKSILRITIAWMEELTEFDEQDFNQVDLRMRGETTLYRELIGTFNPISELHWVKRKFFDEPAPGVQNQLFVLHSDFRDNLFLDDAYIERLINNHSHDPNNYRVYVLGQWGKVVTGSEFYKNFKMTEHIQDLEHKPQLPVHITFDFNVIPYMACSMWQIQKIEKNHHVWGLKEIRAVHPRNSTEDVCHTILEDWQDYLGAGIIIYGDATGRARKTSSKVTDYMIIENILKQHIIEVRVPRSNPLPQDTHTFMNRMLWGTFPIKFSVNPEMKYVIQDFTHVLEDGDRRKIKEKAKDSITKQVYEKYGHFSDGADYFMCEVFKHYM